MRWSLMMQHVSSWGKLPKQFGNSVLNFVTWVDMFPFDWNVLVSLYNIPGVQINLSICLHYKFHIAFIQFSLSIDSLQSWKFTLWSCNC